MDAKDQTRSSPVVSGEPTNIDGEPVGCETADQNPQLGKYIWKLQMFSSILNQDLELGKLMATNSWKYRSKNMSSNVHN